MNAMLQILDEKDSLQWCCYDVALLDFLNIFLFREHDILQK